VKKLVDWVFLSVIGVLAGFFYSIIGYMFSVFLNDEKMRLFSKAEMLQCLASSVMLAFFIAAFFSTSSSCPSSPLASTEQQFIEGAVCPAIYGIKSDVSNTLDQLQQLYNENFRANMAVEREASHCYSFVSINFYCGDWVLHGEVEKAHFIAWRSVQLMVALEAEKYLIELLLNLDTFLSIFIAGGLVLRAFAPTRGIGALLLALGFGFYIVYPLLYEGVKGFSGIGLSYFAPSLLLGDLERCYLTDDAALSQIVSGAYASNAGAMYYQASNMIAYLSIGVFLYQFILLGITLIFVRTLAFIFGGDAGDILMGVSKIV